MQQGLILDRVMHRQLGMTLIELLGVIALAILLISVTIVVSLSTLNRSGSRGAIQKVQSLAQFARMEAVSRNRDCRVLLSPELRQLMVTDGRGTPTGDDDVVLQRAALPTSVVFGRPDPGDAVGWRSLGGSPEWYGVRYGADGTVAEGDGDLFVQAGESYGRLSVFVSGATQVATWKNGNWHTASD